MPIAQSSSVHVTRVLDRTQLAPGVVLIGLHAPELARVTRPGQFLMAIPPLGERIATALGIYENQRDRVSLMFFVCGPRTRELERLDIGDRLDVMGPLGNGFDLSNAADDVAIVAGGVGIASVLLPAQALLKDGARVRLFYGARTAELLVDKDKFAGAGCEVLCATDDGSYGHRGFVTELLMRVAKPPKMILACGPSPMLRATARVAAELEIPAQLSLEETFACGVGGCWGCVVPVDRNSAQAPGFPGASRGGSDTVNARICKEGPVFWAHELRW
ncbi:MAG: dihydroorotate dehydrogenase electron transfer subunit [Candidatus Eremiobacteraeota bacterium]|nr:dihydroorotate dehydrogenase electron transfer subunit [Candidatus Eremiobacteraeota bacterium]